MTTDYDALAAELLPCAGGDYCVIAAAQNRLQGAAGEHDLECPAFYRPAVAAALKKVAEEGRGECVWVRCERNGIVAFIPPHSGVGSQGEVDPFCSYCGGKLTVRPETAGKEE